MKVVSIVGMTGSGKSEVARAFEKAGFTRIRFGDLTDEVMKKQGLAPNEENERLVRERLRQEDGMAAYAKLNLPRIEQALNPSQGEGQDVVIDGLYSWEEYTYLKGRYEEDLYLVAVWSSPKTRYARLGKRSSRRLTREEAISRDRAEIENSNTGGPIAMADFTIINESTLEDLRKRVKRTIAALR
jgi:dephospho-CoA kinase